MQHASGLVLPDIVISCHVAPMILYSHRYILYVLILFKRHGNAL